MELIKDAIKLDNRIDFGKFQTFIEAETVVPDKKLDVYEIINTEGYISLRKIEAGDGKILFRGSLNYNVIYISDDKRTVSNVDGRIDINEVVEKDSIEREMSHMLFTEIEHIDCSIMNERKLKIGALMNVRGSLFEKKSFDIVKDVTDVDDIQKHRKEIKYQDVVGVEQSESSIRDTININTNEIDSIISLNPCAKVKESRVTDNKVIIGGVLEMSPLACTIDGELVELEDICIEFTQFVELAGAMDGMKEEVLLTLSEFNYDFKKSDSDNCMLEIDCTVLCMVKVTEDVTREVLQDAYSPKTMLKFDHKPIKLNKILNNDENTFTLRETVKNNKDDIQIKDVVSVCCSASIENTYIEDDKSVVQGILKCDILYVPVEGLKSVYKISEEIPFEHEINVEKLSDASTIFNTISIDKVESDLNRDQIDLTVRLRRFTEAVDKKTENCIIRGEDEGPYDLSNAPSIVVYICKEGDTFWNIAKKYNTTESEITEINEMNIEEPLKEGSCLILEKKVEALN